MNIKTRGHYNVFERNSTLQVPDVQYKLDVIDLLNSIYGSFPIAPVFLCPGMIISFIMDSNESELPTALYAFYSLKQIDHAFAACTTESVGPEEKLLQSTALVPDFENRGSLCRNIANDDDTI